MIGQDQVQLCQVYVAFLPRELLAAALRSIHAARLAIQSAAVQNAPVLEQSLHRVQLFVLVQVSKVDISFVEGPHVTFVPLWVVKNSMGHAPRAHLFDAPFAEPIFSIEIPGAEPELKVCIHHR